VDSIEVVGTHRVAEVVERGSGGAIEGQRDSDTASDTGGDSRAPWKDDNCAPSLRERTVRLRMGVHPLPLDTWIDLDRGNLEVELAAKRELIAWRHDEVVAAVDHPEVVAACEELDDLVVRWWSGRDQRPPEPDPSFHPIVRASLRTQEDWCLLDASPGGSPVLVAGCVCFPTRWILAGKTRPVRRRDPRPGRVL